MKIDRRFISASSAGLYDRPPTTPSAAEHGPDAHKSRCVRMNVYTYILEVLVHMESSHIYGSTTKQIQDKEILSLMSVKLAIGQYQSIIFLTFA
jgi:hypothetical protein